MELNRTERNGEPNTVDCHCQC